MIRKEIRWLLILHRILCPMVCHTSVYYVTQSIRHFRCSCRIACGVEALRCISCSITCYSCQRQHLKGIARFAITHQTREKVLKILVILGLALSMDVTSPSRPTHQLPASEAQKKRDTCVRGVGLVRSNFSFTDSLAESVLL